jgi:hypothetical protein
VTSPRISESAFQAQLEHLLRLHGWKYTHFRAAQVRGRWMTPLAGDAGFPDLVATNGDSVMFIEVKSAIGRLSAGQKAWLNLLSAAGMEVHVWRPADLPTAIQRISRKKQK